MMQPKQKLVLLKGHWNSHNDDPVMRTYPETDQAETLLRNRRVSEMKLHHL